MKERKAFWGENEEPWIEYESVEGLPGRYLFVG